MATAITCHPTHSSVRINAEDWVAEPMNTLQEVDAREILVPVVTVRKATNARTTIQTYKTPTTEHRPKTHLETDFIKHTFNQ
jgi:hypothetical protein